MAVTWNPSDKASYITLSNSDLTAACTDRSWGGVRATISKSSGKWYWEISIDNTEYFVLGVGTSSADLYGHVGSDAYGYGYDGDDGSTYPGPWAYGDAYTTGDVIGIALDLDNGKIWWSKNNTWQNSGDPAAGTGFAYSGLSGSFFPMFSGQDILAIGTARFLGTSQSYSPPSGFSPIEQISGDTNLFDCKIKIKNSSTDLLDGKTKIKDSGTDLLDGKGIISSIKLLDGKGIIKSSDTDLLDGNAEIIQIDTSILDGKGLIGDSHTNIFDGKGVIESSDTDLFDGKARINATTKIDGKAIIRNSGVNLLDSKTIIRNSDINLLDGRLIIRRVDTDLLDGKVISTYIATINSDCPTPTCDLLGVFRNVKIEDIIIPPSANITIGKILEGKYPAPDMVCMAYPGRNPSLDGNVPAITCSSIVGISLSDVATISHNAGIPVPLSDIVADSHNITTLYGNIPSIGFACNSISENIININGYIPPVCGRFTPSVGNVAIIKASPCTPTCSINAIAGILTNITGNAPALSALSRFYASRANTEIMLNGSAPTPFMVSYVKCSVVEEILKYVRGSIR